MGPAQADRALDDTYLAVRVSYRSSRLLNALPMVPSPRSLSDVTSAVLSGTTRLLTISSMRWGMRTLKRRTGKSLRCQNLALNGDLMFDQGDVLPRMKENLW